MDRKIKERNTHEDQLDDTIAGTGESDGQTHEERPCSTKNPIVSPLCSLCHPLIQELLTIVEVSTRRTKVERLGVVLAMQFIRMKCVVLDWTRAYLVETLSLWDFVLDCGR